MTGGGLGSPSRPKKAWPQSPPLPPKKTAIILLKFSNLVLRRTLAGNFDQERPLSLKWDEAGTLPNTGSIGGITAPVQRCWTPHVLCGAVEGDIHPSEKRDQ